MLNEAGPRGTVSSDFDLAGRRTRIVYPDGFFVDQDHLVTGEIWKIRENGATSGIGVLATFAYDDLGRRTGLARGNGTVTSYGYDAVSRLTSLGQDLGGTAYDLTLGFAYNPASQIASNTRSNDAYAWLGHGGGTTNSSVNGLSQIAVHGGASVGHDPKGNLTSDPTIGKSYGYSSENLLTSVGLSSGHVGTITYDPLMRLAESGVNSRTKPVHDGGQRIFEYYGAGNEPGARFVNAPGLDEPLLEYQGPGLATRRWLHADERGSIVARSDDSGNLANVNTFDEQGLIGPTNRGRFHFAGQPYETTSDLYYSRARMRNPRLGRFNQPDPIGYGDGMNMYAYVGGDPVNYTDPSGTCMLLTYSMHYYNSAGDDIGEVPDSRWTELSADCYSSGGGAGGIFYTGGKGGVIGGEGGNNGVAGGKAYTEQTPEEQRKNCQTNRDIARGLSMPSVRARAAEAFTADYRTHWEWGFWTAPKGNSVHAFGIGTSREFGWMDPNDAHPWMISRIWHGTGAPNVMYHTHRNGLGLSVDDVSWAKSTGNSIVAIGGKDVNFCYPG
jgi:RHS repeat-associated protein